MQTHKQTPKDIKHIGLTGNIGSGKSSVAKIFVSNGAALIDADELAKTATQDKSVLTEISKKLGSDLLKNGVLNRQKTAELVFNNPEALKTLNAIIHPWVREQSLAQASAFAEQKNPPKIIIHDIPLLYENALETTLDAVIVVSAPLALRIERVKARSNLSEVDIKARDSAQMPLSEKEKRADYVIYNDADFKTLKQRTAKVWDLLNGAWSVEGRT